MARREDLDPVVELVDAAREVGLVTGDDMPVIRYITRSMPRTIWVSREVAEKVYAEFGRVSWTRQLRHVASLEARHWSANPGERLAGFRVAAIDALFHRPAIGLPNRVIFWGRDCVVDLPETDVPVASQKARAVFFICIRMFRYQWEQDGKVRVRRDQPRLGTPPEGSDDSAV